MPHIPKKQTADLEILSFQEALSKNTPKTYDPEKWLYVPDFYTEYRYVLGTRGSNPVICVGINPSTAEPDHLDPTLQSVSRVAASNGYDSWLMFNVYAQRATRPDDMDLQRNELLHRENMNAFSAVLDISAANDHATVVWAAWGAIIEKRFWLRDCVSDMMRTADRYNAVWVCAGPCSKKGHPHHPLYLKKDEIFHPFDLAGYLA